MAKMTKKGRNFVSDEISHLMKEGPSKGPQKGKKMPQKQAVAVALDVARRKGFKSAPNPNKEESVASMFDDLIQEGSLPPALQKYKITGGGGKSDDDDADDKPDFLKKGDDDSDDKDDKPDFLKKGDDDDDCSEQSMFDAIVQESSAGKSVFDDIVESSSNAEANWEDRMARTLTLADELVSIRGSYKK